MFPTSSWLFLPDGIIKPATCLVAKKNGTGTGSALRDYDYKYRNHIIW